MSRAWARSAQPRWGGEPWWWHPEGCPDEAARRAVESERNLWTDRLFAEAGSMEIEHQPLYIGARDS